jgi:hypothetical protein
MAATVRFCGSCGAANPGNGTHCGQCGAALAPPAAPAPAPAPTYAQGYAPASAARLAQALPHKTAAPIPWLLAGGAVLALAIVLTSVSFLFRTLSPGGHSPCPPRCAPVPKSPPLSAPHTYTSKTLGWSVDYYDRTPTSQVSFGVTHQDTDLITWTLVDKRSPGSWPITVQGEKAAGRSPQQVLDQFQKARFPDARTDYPIPGAEIGYTDGVGAMYDIEFSEVGGSSQRARLAIVVAIKNDVVVEVIAVGPYIPNSPSNFEHPNPASTITVTYMSHLANDVRWKGEPPL